MALNNLTPITRLEKFLYKISGGSVSISPITRQEYFLDKIAENVSGGLPSYSGGSDAYKILRIEYDGGYKPVWNYAARTFIFTESEGTWSCNRSVQDVFDAVEYGIPLIFNVDGAGLHSTEWYVDNEDNVQVIFKYADSTKMYLDIFTITSLDTITKVSKTITFDA